MKMENIHSLSPRTNPFRNLSSRNTYIQRGWLHYCFQWGAKGSKMGKKIPNLTYIPICRGLVTRKQFNHWLSSSTNQRFSVILTPSLLQGVSKRHEPVVMRDTWEAQRTGDTKRLSTFWCRSQRRPGFDPWVGKIPWRRKWQPTPVFLPGESHGQRSLEGYSPQGHKESGTQVIGCIIYLLLSYLQPSIARL